MSKEQTSVPNLLEIAEKYRSLLMYILTKRKPNMKAVKKELGEVERALKKAGVEL
jgi:hypothetical protein